MIQFIAMRPEFGGKVIIFAPEETRGGVVIMADNPDHAAVRAADIFGVALSNVVVSLDARMWASRFPR